MGLLYKVCEHEGVITFKVRQLLRFLYNCENVGKRGNIYLPIIVGSRIGAEFSFKHDNEIKLLAQ